MGRVGRWELYAYSDFNFDQIGIEVMTQRLLLHLIMSLTAFIWLVKLTFDKFVWEQKTVPCWLVTCYLTSGNIWIADGEEISKQYLYIWKLNIIPNSPSLNKISQKNNKKISDEDGLALASTPSHSIPLKMDVTSDDVAVSVWFPKAVP